MLRIINGINLINDVFKYDVILVPMSINNYMSKGFKYEVALNFPYVKEKQNESSYGDIRKYGTINPIDCNGIIFCLCYMYTTPCYRNGCSSDYVKYDALERCLTSIAEKFDGKKIGTPILGADKFDGNGNKDRILEIFENSFKESYVTVYDYEQRDYVKDMFVEIATLHGRFKRKEMNIEDYIAERSKIEWRRRYGIFSKMPEDYKYIPRKGEIRK